ncbi:flagellar basal body rod C-terminal domain-containing protein [Halomonas sp. PR-M31]|uniref:flagellar basal body rod C-terminal domain-containing protein n=1 Tax=Halomonas sp. PR-M31 TaxID=1471202 RepID=UPI00345FA42D
MLPHNDNNGSGITVEVAFVDSSKVSTSDYDVRFEGAGSADIVITRRATGETVDVTRGTDANGDPTLVFDGLQLTLKDAGTNPLSEGDRFQIQPTRDLAGMIFNKINDTSKIAAAEDSIDGPGEGPLSSGDNRNALALQNLQNLDIVGGKASISEAYASIVSDVGNRTNVVKANLSAQQGLAEQLTAVQQSESGVNLDEEAANLIRFQKYYQANAKVIETGSNMLDAILNLR